MIRRPNEGGADRDSLRYRAARHNLERAEAVGYLTREYTPHAANASRTPSLVKTRHSDIYSGPREVMAVQARIPQCPLSDGMAAIEPLPSAASSDQPGRPEVAPGASAGSVMGRAKKHFTQAVSPWRLGGESGWRPMGSGSARCMDCHPHWSVSPRCRWPHRAGRQP